MAGAASSSGPPAQAPGASDTARELIGHYTPVTKLLWAQRLAWRDESDGGGAGGGADSGDSQGLPADPLAPRAPQQTAVTYPFSRDRGLVETYANPWRGMRVGRLLEDLDSLAGSVAVRHCAVRGRQLPHLVTVGVDAIRAHKVLQLDRDLKLEGQVVWTGRSSVDIRMQLTQDGVSSAEDPSLVAVFSFVSLANGRPAPVPPLAPGAGAEAEWFAQRQAVADARRAARARAAEAGDDHPLPLDAADKLDQLFAAARVVRDMPSLAPPNDMLMAQTSLSNTFTCQPQQRNPHGRVFGGFLLRRAFELAFATAYQFAGSRPVFDRVDDVQFKRPVDVGDLMRLRSCVLDADESGLVTVLVEAAVIAPERRTSQPTNAFTFALLVAPAPGSGGGARLQLRRVLPGSEDDVMRLRQHWAEVALG